MSNRILTTDIAAGRKLPLTKGRLDFIQDNTEQLARSIAEGVLGIYTTGDIIIWKGCVFTGTDPGARTMTAGVIYYNGLFYQVPSASFTTIGSNIPLWTKVTTPSDLATFSDGFNADVEQTETFVLVAGPVGGSGVTGYIADYNGATVKSIEQYIPKTDGEIKLRHKVIAIGDWNMDTTAQILIAHGIGSAWQNIVTIRVMIIQDGTVNSLPLDVGTSGGASVNGRFWAVPLSIVLERSTGLDFDNTSYDATSFNRGWIYITYMA